MSEDANSPSLRHDVRAVPPDADERRNPFVPVRRFVHEHWKKNVAIAAGIFCLCVSTCQMIRHVAAVERKGYAFVVGEDGTVVYGRLRGLNADSGAYRRFLRTIVRLRLQLTPDGLSDPEGAESVFIGDAKAKLDTDVQKWLRYARANNLFSVPFITSYKKVGERASGWPVFEIRGYTLVTGIAGSVPSRDQEPFAMTVVIAPNPKLDRDEQVDAPFVVRDYLGYFNQRELDAAREKRGNQ